MWVIAEYEATTLFTLKPATATASGGRTLLVPTPFAIKMALLNAAYSLHGQAAEAEWEWIGGLPVALNPAARVVVNNTFIKILRPRRNPAEPGSQDAGYFGRTITYREYAQLNGRLGIALQVDQSDQADKLRRWLVNINYLGKRGSFVQISGVPDITDSLPDDYLVIDGDLSDFPVDSILTQLDDVGDDVDFDAVSIYSGKRITLGKQRVLRHAALPYHVVSSSRGYTYYERNELSQEAAAP
ncbi:MAG TPA: hypothetical protein VKY59_07755 [Spirillospora sp.]|nr:hypothetical protein [Spirillospora sp.]